MDALTGDYIRLRSMTNTLTAGIAGAGTEEPIGREANAAVELNNTGDTDTTFGNLLTKKISETAELPNLTGLSNTADTAKAGFTSKLQFSAHSLKRIESRNINIADVCEKLERGTSIAEAKGAENSLILVNTAAFIVNISSHKVITALSDSDLHGAAFTNIDTTVIM